MATRENQGLQIALIIFLMITVGLAISTYYYFRQAEEQFKLATDYDAKAKAAEARSKSMYYQVEALKSMVGASKLSPEGITAIRPATVDDGIKEVDRIAEDFKSDMALFDGSVAPENRNWRALPAFLMASLMKRNNDLNVAVESEKKTVADKDTAIAAENSKVTAAMAGLDKAKTDVLAVDATFKGEVDKANKDKGELEQTIDKQQKEFATQIAALTKQLADEKQKSQGLNAEVRGKAARIKELTNESFERPHGEVTWVNMRTGTCYINLGRADGLQRAVTFSVYDPEVNTLEVPNAADERKKREDAPVGPKRKASIEVTEIIDEHLAECRILDDNIKNPLLPGDKIFTPAWRPGQRLQFALVGRMNVDGNRQDDRMKVKNLIESNGGEIVAEVLDNGTRVGNISPNTRFLVIGERPEDATDDKVRAAFNDIIGAAERNGVQQISVQDLVSMMGYKGTDRTVTLGNTGAAEVEKKSDKKQFRPRPRPADAGAF